MMLSFSQAIDSVISYRREGKRVALHITKMSAFVGRAMHSMGYSMVVGLFYSGTIVVVHNDVVAGVWYLFRNPRRERQFASNLRNASARQQ